MFVKHHYIYPEEKEPVSEGESGASSEDHSERHQQLHHHYPGHHPGLRGGEREGGGGGGANWWFLLPVLPANVNGMETMHGVMSPSNNGGIVQYTTNSDTAGPFFVPSMSTIGSSSGLGSPQEDTSR